MNMRSCTLVLVLSLVSPAVVNAVCELTCLHAHHHGNAEALAAECHGHGATPASAVAVSAADPALCHDAAPVPSAIVKAPPQLASVPVVASTPRPAALNVPARLSLRGRLWSDPSDLLLITTQLRI
jgi:hypothetical protein